MHVCIFMKCLGSYSLFWQTIVHPLQDRVLTIRENARLQGFPDCYQLFGPVKERYIYCALVLYLYIRIGQYCGIILS